MYEKLSRFVERQITVVGGFLIVAVFVLWFLSQFIDPLKSFLTEGTFFDVVLVVLLFEILRRVIELKLEGRASGARIALNQDEAWADLQKYIRTHRPKAVDMIEYSGGTIISLLEEIFQGSPNVAVRLLLCHPESARSGFEKRRIGTTLEYLQSKMSDYPGITVRCYRVPASMRGRSFDGEFFNVGWYTYHMRRGREEIQGHLNAMVTASVATPEGKNLRATFSKAFDDLWSHPNTVDGTKVKLLWHEVGDEPVPPPIVDTS